ncbi:MAG TPA: hypothetical protein PLD25_25725 [Chloroflexota bacterium]|nr:hypothetical protein [Chloroflexota bacterium]HUM70557.1 hypothetical protein [Chloroflexota bacterium]
MRQNNAGCLTGLIAGFSRIMLLMFWIARPNVMDSMFGSFLVPCLGFLFLPFTTLMYVLLQANAVGGLSGLDWLWLGLAALMDIASIASAGYSNRDRIPAGMPGSTPQGG